MTQQEQYCKGFPSCKEEKECWYLRTMKDINTRPATTDIARRGQVDAASDAARAAIKAGCPKIPRS